MNYRKQLNVVPTTTEQNLGAAKACETYQKACLLFRKLEHANDRGTTASLYAELERRWEIKQQTPFGQWLEKVAADQS